MRHLISLIILTLTLALRLGAESEAIWSTNVAVPGERVMLYIVCDPTPQEQGRRIYLNMPQVKGASIREAALPGPVESSDGKKVRILQIVPICVIPDTAGTFKIGEIEVLYNSGRREKVQIPPLPVCSTSDIKWYNKPIPYGVLWHLDTKDGYEQQSVKSAFKLFMPNESRFPIRWFVQYSPVFNSVGVEAGTFRPSLEGLMANLHRSYINTPSAFAKGQEWHTLDFAGSFTPVKSGTHDVSGKISMTKAQGYSMTEQFDILLPTLKLSALPLPPGAPTGFADLVGEYSVTAKTSADSLAMNEALEVELTIKGSGPLDRVKCPIPESADNWKLTPATRKVITGLNNDVKAIVYTQLMRPVTEVGGVPAFSLGYFDPKKQEYASATTRPIPLPWRQTDAASAGLQTAVAAEPPPAGTIPVAEMTDIYSAFMPPDDSTLQRLPRWLCYLLYLPAIGILLTLAGMAVHRRIAAGAAGRALERELTALGRTENGLVFLKGIGSFIESRIPADAMTPELQAILNKRDDLAFRPDAKSETVGATERQSMLKQVRRALSKAGNAAILLLASLFFLGAGAMAEESTPEQEARTSYESAQYSACLEKLQPLLACDTPSAEAWFNAGNCEYRLNHPGKAALCYARALQIKPWMKEAKANLAFIQRKEGAVVPNPGTTDEIFTFLSAGQLWLLTLFSTSMLALCISLQIVRRRKQRPWLHASTALTAILSILCAVNWVYYSTREVADISTLPPSDLAYVTTATDARTAAAADASSVLQLPASTPVHLLAKRGSWAYVETFTGVRGWVKSDAVESLAPGDKPTMPVYVRFD